MSTSSDPSTFCASAAAPSRPTTSPAAPRACFRAEPANVEGTFVNRRRPSPRPWAPRRRPPVRADAPLRRRGRCAASLPAVPEKDRRPSLLSSTPTGEAGPNTCVGDAVATRPPRLRPAVASSRKIAPLKRFVMPHHAHRFRTAPVDSRVHVVGRPSAPAAGSSPSTAPSPMRTALARGVGAFEPQPGRQEARPS